MTTTVESVDNLPKPPPQDKVNPTERSSTEQQRRQFRKALKEELEQDEGDRKGKDHQHADAVVVGQDREAGSQHDPGGRQAFRAKPGAEKTEDNGKEEPSSERHVDLTA